MARARRASQRQLFQPADSSAGKMVSIIKKKQQVCNHLHRGNVKFAHLARVYTVYVYTTPGHGVASGGIVDGTSGNGSFDDEITRWKFCGFFAIFAC